MLRRFLEYYGPPFLAVNRASTRASPARRVIPWRAPHSSKGIKYLRGRPERSRSSAGGARPRSGKGGFRLLRGDPPALRGALGGRAVCSASPARGGCART